MSTPETQVRKVSWLIDALDLASPSPHFVRPASPRPVEPVQPVITWATPAAITYGDALSATQLNATVAPADAGPLTYDPPLGTALAAGTRTLQVSTAATDAYLAAEGSVELVVDRAPAKVEWATPAEITYGTKLDGTQLNATVTPSEAGTPIYDPPAGAVLGAGTRRLKATLARSDNYLAAEAGVDLVVGRAPAKIEWATPAEITYGTKLDGTQLNATVTPAEAGPPIYDPAAGSLPKTGTRKLKASTKETDNYLAAEASVDLVVKEDGELAPLRALFGVDEQAAAKLHALVDDGFDGDPAALKTAMKALGGAARLGALLTKGALEGAGVRQLIDGLGAPLLGAMMGKGDDPAAAIALAKELGGDTKPLKDLVDGAGFAGQPEALAALHARGCKGDAKQFVELCRAFADPAEREALKAMVGGDAGQAGLGAHPEMLGELFAVGCDGAPDQLKKLTASFKDPTAAADLKRLVDSGGFADPKVKPELLGQLLAHGAGDPAPDAEARAKALAKLCKELDGPAGGKLKDVLVEGGLGQQPEAFGHVVGIACKGDAAKLKDFTGAFDAKDKRDGLARLTSQGGLGGKKDVVDARCLARLVELGQPKADTADMATKSAGFAKLCKELDLAACGKLKDVLEEGGLGRQPESFAHAVGIACKGDAAKLTDLVGAFDSEDKRKGLARLGAKGVLGAEDGVVDATCLARVIELGQPKADTVDMATKSAGFAKLCEELDAPTCGKLKEVLKEGALGKEPEAFGHVVGIACKGTAANLKDFVAALDSEDKRKGLARLGAKGVLGAEDGVVDATCLAHLIDLGRPDADTATIATKSGTFATLCEKLDVKGCKDFGKLVKDGGLGTDPKVLGHFVGIGCQGDADKLKPLADAIAQDATATGKLEKLVRDGGFGTADRGKAATGTDPKCLAELIHTGCEDQPGELVKLVNGLDAPDHANLKEVMKNGGLGDKPKVLANSYKFGCVSDPYGAATDKNPVKLKELATTFGSPGDAPKLKELIEQGGLDDAHPEWLGKVMRDAFTDRAYPRPVPPSGMAQDPAKLKDLHTAFNGHMADLKVMIEAMGTMPAKCGDNDEPGRALQNVLKSANLPITDLKTRFSDTLKARALVPAPVLIAVGGIAPAPKLTREELIQNAASMEFDAQPPGSQAIAGYDTDVHHVLVRHARRADVRQGAPGNNNTGFFPKNCEKATIIAIIAASIADCTGPKAKIQPPPPNNPPIRQSDLIGAGRQYENVVGAGYTGTLGFKKKPPNSPAGAVQVGQYYPTAGPGVVSVSADDLTAIKSALNK